MTASGIRVGGFPIPCRGTMATRIRQLEFPATSRVTSGTESRFPNPCDDHDGIGNPSGRIPDSQSGHHGNEDAISFTGNPDIRVPERLKRDDGLRAGGALEEEDAGEDVSGEKRRNREPERRPPTEEPKNSSVNDNTTRLEVPEERDSATSPEGRGLIRYGPI
ncbi:hypothetical protein NDU88_009756 [Pleurodeles waltl]|uniref:Uncharacterized protein n=1 Tax=Pleurodeles waltl TaxID=8319 RepID=A0AAV7QVI9_PLEWA|nr:hypothetical protein NDU88_009756 [Pleurodeles waltl]